jgi:hypothetical protein
MCPVFRLARPAFGLKIWHELNATYRVRTCTNFTSKGLLPRRGVSSAVWLIFRIRYRAKSLCLLWVRNSLVYCVTIYMKFVALYSRQWLGRNIHMYTNELRALVVDKTQLDEYRIHPVRIVTAVRVDSWGVHQQTGKYLESGPLLSWRITSENRSECCWMHNIQHESGWN